MNLGDQEFHNEENSNLVEYDPASIIKSMRDEYFQSLEQEEDDQPRESVELVLFRLGEQQFAVKVTEVRAIVRPPRITKLPLSPIHLMGVINLRGEIKPVLDLHTVFDMPPREMVKPRIIVIKETIRDVGIMVDEILDLYEVYVQDIHPAVQINTKIRPAYLQGKIEIEDRLTLLMDLATLLHSDELAVRTK